MTAETEQVVISRIKIDHNQSSGGCTRDTGKIVKAAAEHVLENGLSAELESVLDDYERQLSANVEDNTSWRHAQSIRAIKLKLQGIYFLDDKWGEALNQWIESQGDKLPFLSDLDDLSRLAPKAKATKKWRGQVEAFFEDYGSNDVLDFIRQAINLLLEPAEIAAGGIYFDNEDKLGAMVHILTLDRDDADSPMLRRLANAAYQKVPYKGPVSTSVGNLCVNALCDSPGPQGLVQLAELAAELKYPNNAVFLVGKKLEETAEAKGATVQELQNQAVPDHGLSD